MERSEQSHRASVQQTTFDRRISVAPTMDWSDAVEITNDLNHLKYRDHVRPHFVHKPTYGDVGPPLRAVRREKSLGTTVCKGAQQFASNTERAVVGLRCGGSSEVILTLLPGE